MSCEISQFVDDTLECELILMRQEIFVCTNNRDGTFSWMSKSSESAMESFKLPTNRVVELGSQVQI